LTKSEKEGLFLCFFARQKKRLLDLNQANVCGVLGFSQDVETEFCMADKV
jgi:hypothetical protein